MKRDLISLSVCLFVVSCGDENAPAVATAIESAGRAGSSIAADAGARSVDASIPQHVGDAGVFDAAAMSGSGGVGGRGASGAGAGAGTTSSEPDESDAGAAPTATVTLTGQVIQVQASGNFTPYGGAEVCVLDSMPKVCASADPSGMLVIQLPANSRTGLTMDLPGMFPMLTPITTGAADIDLSGRGAWSNYGAAVVLAEEARTSATSMLGTTFDMNMGQADMIVFGLRSGTVTLEGAPAELKWFTSSGRFTVTDGAAPLGSVLHGFTNVEPGMRTFRAEMNGQPCAFDPMIWPGDEPGTVNVPIRAGRWTRLLEVRCD